MTRPRVEVCYLPSETKKRPGRRAELGGLPVQRVDYLLPSEEQVCPSPPREEASDPGVLRLTLPSDSMAHHTGACLRS